MNKATTDGRAVIYVRVSTDEQADAYGLDVQRERCRAMATVKGFTVVAEHVDAGLSGTLAPAARPGLAAALAAVDAGDADTLIVYALDRLGRRTAIVLDVVERLRVAGCAVVSCRESLDGTTPAGAFTLTMFAALAQLERDTIVERTTAGRNARGQVDGERGGRVPFGYRRGDGGPVIDADAAAIVRRIIAERRRKGGTLQAIADGLNADGIASPRGGRAWYPSSVAAVLANADAYAGGTRGASSVRWPAILAA